MAIPVALFNFYANKLVVKFEDLSSNNPTSWLWDFGDTTDSNEQNPEKTYTDSGTYKVKLTATNTDGSNSFEYTFVVSTSQGVNQTIETMVRELLPSGFELSAIELTQAVRRWQMYLQPKVYLPFTVTEDDMFDQSKWPSLANVLISKLINYEQLIEAASRTMSGGVASTSGGSAGTGALKRMESGPSVAEWYDSSEFWKTVFNGKTDTGFFANLQQDVCIFANRQNIHIPEICGSKKLLTLFGVSKKPCKSYNWPWGISHG